MLGSRPGRRHLPGRDDLRFLSLNSRQQHQQKPQQYYSGHRSAQQRQRSSVALQLHIPQIHDQLRHLRHGGHLRNHPPGQPHAPSGYLTTNSGMISSHVFDLFTCKKMVNGGWCLLGLFYFGVVGSMVFLMIIGGVSHVFCDYFNGVINIQSNFISYSMQA